MTKTKKSLRWNVIAKTVGILTIGGLLGSFITFQCIDRSIIKYVEENREEYYDKKVEQIEKELKLIEE